MKGVRKRKKLENIKFGVTQISEITRCKATVTLKKKGIIKLKFIDKYKNKQ